VTYTIHVGDSSVAVEADSALQAARQAADLYMAKDPDFVFVVSDGIDEWTYSLCSQWAEELLDD
jgi:hypothetical protein